MQRFMGFGQMLMLTFACHMKAKELGYKYTICEWHDKVAYLWDNFGRCKGVIQTPRDWKWNIKFVNKGVIPRRIRSIDLSKEDSLYDGCPPIMSDKFIMVPYLDYLNKYYMDTNTYPVIPVSKDTDEKYILFHYRHSEQDRQQYRNTPIKEFKEIYIKLKDEYGNKVKFKKFGEPSPIDNEFDEISDYKPNNIIDVFDLVNNSFMYVGGPAGSISLPYMFGIPTIILLDKVTKLDYVSEKYNLKFGKNLYDWLNPEKISYIYV